MGSNIEVSQFIKRGIVVSIDPGNLQRIGETKASDDHDIRRALEAARKSFPLWSRMEPIERAKYILKAGEYIRQRSHDIAKLITRENGKALIESYTSDILPVLELIDFYTGPALEFLSREDINLGIWSLPWRKSHIEFRPLGTVAVISPWNYPLFLPARDVIAALIAGNCVILKPSENTPFIAEELNNALAYAGIPEGVFSILHGGGQTGAMLVESGVEKISFTGSVATGRSIMKNASSRLIPLTLELGGKDPMIVLDDANIECAVQAAVWGAFTNSGQTCSSVERLYLQRKIAKEFIRMLIEETEKLRQGYGLDDVDIGAMTTEQQILKVEEHIRDAVNNGAKILCGGIRNQKLNGYYFLPTVINGVDHSMRIMREETFGPVLPIMYFDDDEEAIKLSNDSEYALTASVFTENIKRGIKIASLLKAGTVMINDNVFAAAIPQAPWGGSKNSGFGRAGSRYGLLEFVEIVHIHTNYTPSFKNMWWYPYSKNKQAIIEKIIKNRYASGLSKIKSYIHILTAYLKI
ncbi:MAG: aldehyde dehydrogenase family protein [Candidatus Aenigmatarchaeota archaeon]